jgi:hypothetical protein
MVRRFRDERPSARCGEKKRPRSPSSPAGPWLGYGGPHVQRATRSMQCVWLTNCKPAAAERKKMPRGAFAGLGWMSRCRLGCRAGPFQRRQSGGRMWPKCARRIARKETPLLQRFGGVSSGKGPSFWMGSRVPCAGQALAGGRRPTLSTLRAYKEMKPRLRAAWGVAGSSA